MSRVGTLIGRWRCGPPPAEELEWTQDQVRLSRICLCERAGWLGVPLRHADVLVDRRCAGASPVFVELTRKAGRYSGDTRDRWLWRVVDGASAVHEQAPWAQLEVERRPDDTSEVILLDGSGGVVLTRAYPRLPWVFTLDDSERVVWWQWEHHYRHLPRDEVAQIATTFVLSDTVRSVSGANQLASRALYRLARELGWRKMTLKERIRVWGEPGRDRPQWHRQSEVAEALGLGTTGEATLRPPRGRGASLLGRSRHERLVHPRGL